MDVRAARNLLEQMELESYIDVIHDAAVEDWSQPYGEPEAAQEKAETAAAARTFLLKASEYREAFFSFFELSHYATIPQRRNSVDLIDILPILQQYLAHLTQPSQMEQWGCEEADRCLIVWLTWAIDYITYRAWGESRTLIGELIEERNAEIKESEDRRRR